MAHPTEAIKSDGSDSSHNEKSIELAREQAFAGEGAQATTEAYVSEVQQAAQAGQYKFRWASLWEPAVVNPINGKSFTFPILRFWDPYAVAFWMATLGFFSAFFAWFAFSPLVTEAVKVDLKLSPTDVINSNLAGLAGTSVVRLIAGPCVDRYGPRNVMAVLLVLGAIPSALVPTISSLGGLETIRFFISILGGTFVPTQAWTTTFFDKTIVGTANAFSGGWGNLGGGVTPAVMISLYRGLHEKAGLSLHLAWRITFLVFPVPLLLLVALLMMVVSRSHPAGAWRNRHMLPGTAMEVARGGEVHLDASEVREQERAAIETAEKGGRVAPMKRADFRDISDKPGQYSAVDTAVSEPLTLKSFVAIITDLRVLMVAFCYLTTFGLETALDAAFPNLINTIFTKPGKFTPEDAAYVASIYGLCNIYARPLGGVFADVLYNKFSPRGLGVRAKVTFLLICGLLQGVIMIGLGFYIDRKGGPSLGGVIGFIIALATTGFAANGAAYACYGHFRPKNIGTVAGIIGSGGSIGGLVYTAIIKYNQGSKAKGNLGKKFWVCGIFNVAAIVWGFFVPLGDAR